MKDLKSTIIGVLLGLYPIIDSVYNAYIAGQFSGKHGMELGAGIAVMALGIWAKDRNKPTV